MIKAILWAGWLACLLGSVYSGGSSIIGAICLLGAIGFGVGIMHKEKKSG